VARHHALTVGTVHEKIKKTNRPIIPAKGKAEAAEGIRQGLDDVRGGRTRPARDVFDQIRAEYGIPR
jgi:hypothetical protein